MIKTDIKSAIMNDGSAIFIYRRLLLGQKTKKLNSYSQIKKKSQITIIWTHFHYERWQSIFCLLYQLFTYFRA